MRIRVTWFAAVLGGFFSLFLSNSASYAVTVYSYTGANFNIFNSDATPPSGSYTTAMNVSGSFTVAAPFAANLSGLGGALPTSIFLDLSFTDGRQTINLANFDPSGIGSFINVTTDALGTLTSFQFGFVNARPTVVGGQFGQIRGADTDSGGVFDQCLVVTSGVCTSFGVDSAQGFPGGNLILTSTDVAQTPLPAALPMFIGGAGMIGLFARRKKRKVAG